MRQMVPLNIEGKRVKHNVMLYTNENVQCIPFPEQNCMLMAVLSVIFANAKSKTKHSSRSYNVCSRTKFRTAHHQPLADGSDRMAFITAWESLATHNKGIRPSSSLPPWRNTKPH